MNLLLRVKRRFAFEFARYYSDRKWLETVFPLIMGYDLNLDNPKTYNEKLQWLKLYDRNPLYTKLVDKYEVKEYIANIIGKEHIIPTIGVWNNENDIDFDSLPQRFVLKCTHDSGGVIICTDKSKLDIQETKKKLHNGLKRDYFYVNREWPYKNVPHRIIAEEFMEDKSQDAGQMEGLRDYKFFCFNGEPKMVYVGSARLGGSHIDHFDMDFNLLPFERHFGHAKETPQRPRMFEEMKSIAKTLCQGFAHVRVDLYTINNQIYFGELTFHPGAGFREFRPIDWDYKIGEWLKLPEKDYYLNKNNTSMKEIQMKSMGGKIPD